VHAGVGVEPQLVSGACRRFASTSAAATSGEFAGIATELTLLMFPMLGTAVRVVGG
jgi:hypothetical protein